jgi:hypothetical protein
MEHIAALLLIIGCSDDLSQCHELPAPVSVYEAAEDCNQSLPDSLGAFTGQYGRIFARCVPVDPALEEEDAELTWDVRPDGTLVASVDAAPLELMVASESRRQSAREPNAGVVYNAGPWDMAGAE